MISSIEAKYQNFRLQNHLMRLNDAEMRRHVTVLRHIYQGNGIKALHRIISVYDNLSGLDEGLHQLEATDEGKAILSEVNQQWQMIYNAITEFDQKLETKDMLDLSRAAYVILDQEQRDGK